MNLMAIDAATMQAGPERDALIAEKWMGWKLSCSGCWGQPSITKAQKKPGTHYWLPRKGPSIPFKNWSPSTNPAHAGEARRKARVHSLESSGASFRCELAVEPSRFREFCGVAFCTETNGDKGQAEALATCRAIVVALKAAEAVEETTDGN